MLRLHCPPPLTCIAQETRNTRTMLRARVEPMCQGAAIVVQVELTATFELGLFTAGKTSRVN